MQITLSFDTFTELPYTSGTIQNISSQATVEICQDDTVNTGLILGPGEWFSWSNSTLYARSAWDYEPTATCAVVPFKKGGEGGGSEYILPVATNNTLGGVKSSDEAGAIKVDASGKMTYNAPSSTPLSAPDWETNTAYPENALVEYNDNIYVCLAAHTSGTFADDLANGKWKLVSMTLTAATSSALGGVKSNSADGGVTVASDGKMTINLPIATSSTLGGVKSSTDDGKVKVEADGTMTMNGGGLSLWEPSKFYKENAVVIYNNSIYLCREEHTSATDFEYDKWINIGGGGGNGDYGDYVGHITWQMSLQSNYLKLDGTPLAQASVDYKELLKFAQDNSLITADTSDKSLFKYDTNTDVLTLPDYIGLVLQGGNTVEEKEAGLPNITGELGSCSFGSAINEGVVLAQDGAFSQEDGATWTGTYRNSAFPHKRLIFKASSSNSIYGNSTTVQPPAITLIPQIRYQRDVIINDGNATGTVISYLGLTAPLGYLACDGTAYNIADYQALADHINTQFGSYNYFGGDGTTTFAVPDLRGEFLRGTGTNSHANQGSGANVGVHQDGTTFPSFGFSGKSNIWTSQSVLPGGSTVIMSQNKDKSIAGSGAGLYINATADNPTPGNEVLYASRPTNTSVLYCIKA